MKEPNWRTCSEEQVWKYVAYHLAKAGIDSILVGGAVVSIYSEGLYRSGDLDIITNERTKKDLDQAFEKIGFKKTGMHYRNPKCEHIFIQSVSGPLAIGDDLKIRPRIVRFQGKVLRILTPTDCILDRLSAFIYDRARACLEQAALVAVRQPHNLKKIRRWLQEEGQEHVLAEFMEEVRRLKKS